MFEFKDCNVEALNHVIRVLEKFEDINFNRINTFIQSQRNKSVSVVKCGYLVVIKGILNYITINDIYDYTKLLIKLKSIELPTNKIKDNGKIALTDEQIQLIENLEVKDENNILLKDLFLFMCYTGLRESDASQDFNNIKEIALQKGWFEIVQTKEKSNNNAVVAFNLNPHIKEILDKHNWNLKYGSIRTISAKLKKLLSNINEFKDIKQNLKKETMNGTITETKLFIDCIGGHTGRRTFITNMCRKGYAPNDIIKYTGHSDITMITEIYDKTTKEEQLNAINNKMYKKNLVDKYNLETLLNTLSDYRSKGIDIFTTNIKEINLLIDKIRDINTKVISSNYKQLIWDICLNKLDGDTYQIFEMKSGLNVQSIDEIKYNQEIEYNDLYDNVKQETKKYIDNN